MKIFLTLIIVILNLHVFASSLEKQYIGFNRDPKNTTLSKPYQFLQSLLDSLEKEKDYEKAAKTAKNITDYCTKGILGYVNIVIGNGNNNNFSIIKNSFAVAVAYLWHQSDSDPVNVLRQLYQQRKQFQSKTHQDYFGKLYQISVFTLYNLYSTVYPTYLINDFPEEYEKYNQNFFKALMKKNEKSNFYDDEMFGFDLNCDKYCDKYKELSAFLQKITFSIEIKTTKNTLWQYFNNQYNEGINNQKTLSLEVDVFQELQLEETQKKSLHEIRKNISESINIYQNLFPKRTAALFPENEEQDIKFNFITCGYDINTIYGVLPGYTFSKGFK